MDSSTSRRSSSRRRRGTEPSKVDLVMTKGDKAKMWSQPRPEIVDAFVDYLIEQERMCRPPVQAAKLLAFIVDLHKQKPPRPFPPRADVAAHLEMGIPTIDAALSSRAAQGYVKQEVGYEEGNVANRRSSIKLRYYVPSRDLVELYDTIYGKIVRAERREQLVKEGMSEDK